MREFEQRLESGKGEEASALYRGPFLDGFYLQASEFHNDQYRPVFNGMVAGAQSNHAPAALTTDDSLSFTNVGIGDLASYGNIAVAEMHRTLDAPASALAAIQRRPYGTVVWPRYLATALSVERELCALSVLRQQCGSN